MSRKRLVIVALLAFLPLAAHAGEIKIHQWPTQFIPQEVASINVVMDVGFWMEIINQYDIIKLQQVNIHTYEGCIDLKVRSNFDLLLSAAIAPTGAVGGTYSCFLDDPYIAAPGGIATLCAKLQNANLGGQPGGSKNVHVATVTIRVVPK